MVHTYNATLLSLKEEEIQMQAIIWKNLEDIMLREVSQSQTDKYYMTPFYIKYPE